MEKIEKKSNMDFEKLLSSEDVVEVFGNTGSGKTRLALEIAKEYASKGKTVLYLDSEKNLNELPENIEYLYEPNFNKLLSRIKQLEREPDKYDLIVLDSLGAPAVGQFASMDLRSRGDILLGVTEMLYRFKIYSNENNCQVFVTNQPVSAFNKGPGAELQPWGDKSNFFAKEVWRSNTVASDKNMTVVSVKTFKSRKKGKGIELFKMIISDTGLEVKEV